jgi:hypothetical protein
VRNGATDCLAAIAGWLQQYRHAAPLLADALTATGSRRIVDLCSGGAGPWRSLAPALQRRLGGEPGGEPLQVLLTDLYPSWHSPDANPDASRTWACGLDGESSANAGRSGRANWTGWRFTRSPAHPLTQPTASGRTPAHLIFVPFPVDATQVSPALPGLRTLFTAFHHFEPPAAQAILQSAVDAREGIAIFEQTRRHLPALPVMLLLPLLALLFTPFIRPWRVERFFWTYVIPAIPAVLCCDGLVSCLRTYTPDELLALAARLHGPAYAWQAGRVRSPLSPLGVTYLIGAPRAESIK